MVSDIQTWRFVKMKKLALFFFFISFYIPSINPPTHAAIPGQIMIDIKHEYLPITPLPNAPGIIQTGIPSVDSLNVLFQVYAFEKVVDDSWGATKGIYLIRFPDSLDVGLVHSSFSSDPHIHLVGFTGIPKPDVTPHDYYFPSQWGLHKIKCPDAWRYTNGKSSIIIQIIDGGTDYGHPDLVRNIWQNLGEDSDGDGHTIEWNVAQNRWILDPGDLNGLDNDFNGYCDDLVGFDFRDDPCELGNGYGYDPQATNELFGWRDHGDKSAGTAAAVTDNRISTAEATWICWSDTNSVAGTSWFSKIMIARFGYPDYLLYAQAIQAMNYARNNGARIISMSWSDTVDNSVFHAVLDSAYNEGILLIASAGSDSFVPYKYPAAYPNVIAVAGTDNNDVKAPYSNWGTWVDICAPWSNKAPGRGSYWSYYCYQDSFAGTSASAPFVAGVAAMVWSCNLSATNVQVKNAILSTADNIYNIPGNYPYIGKLGSGRVNSLNAVKVFRPVAPPPGDCNSNIVVEGGDVVYLISYLYQYGPLPDPFCVGNVNGDGVIGVGDVTYLISYLYKGGPPPQDGCQ
jgi:hypothetical protein